MNIVIDMLSLFCTILFFFILFFIVGKKRFSKKWQSLPRILASSRIDSNQENLHIFPLLLFLLFLFPFVQIKGPLATWQMIVTIVLIFIWVVIP